MRNYAFNKVNPAVVLVVRGSAGLRDAFVNLHTVSFYEHSNDSISY